MSSKKKSKKTTSGLPSPTVNRQYSSDLDSDCELQFRAISTPQKISQQGNLTGPERKVKDSCADWHNYAEKWKILNARGAAIVTDISNLKISSFGDEECDTKELSEKFETFSAELAKVYESIEKTNRKMRRLTECFHGLNELSLNQSTGSEILFQSWTLDKFVESSSELCKMYDKELDLKKCIVENVCHSTDRAMSMFQISAWLHEPYISKCKHDFLMTSMLVEVGLK